MGFEIEFKGKRLKLSAQGERTSAKELRNLLETIQNTEQVLAETQLRERVVKQLKNEILETTDQGEEIIQGWWDVPADLLKHKDSAKFLTMEADLNPSVHYEKATLKLKVVVEQNGTHHSFDRNQANNLLQKPYLAEILKKSSAALIRIKGALTEEAQAEVEDFFRKAIEVDRLKVLFDKRSYGSRASVEFVMFGDFFGE